MNRGLVHLATDLVFTPSGRVQLQDNHNNRERVLWDSTSVPAFVNQFGTFANADQDADILEWLIANKVIEEHHASTLNIVVDTLTEDDDDLPDDEDERDDFDDEDDDDDDDDEDD